MKIGHEMILASAGSGKTYELTNRFVRLLALGAAPERIVALTFTRKAAGEFFDEILRKLAQAAGEPKAAARLAGEIGVPALGTADFLRLLRMVVEAMHRLHLGTFDGFFARIARNFPLELGLTGEFEVLQDYAARVERGRVLRRMFERTGQLSEEQKEFIEAFKRATFGTDEKRLGVRLDQFIDEHQEVFLAAPNGDLWGNPQLIWPEGNAWFAAMPRRDAAVRALEAEIAQAELKEEQRGRWVAFFADLETWKPGAPMGKGLVYLLGNALKAAPSYEVIVVERKKQLLSPAAGEALRTIVAAVIGAELARQLETTRGIHAVLAAYEAIYHSLVRRAGKLTFADVQRLLLPDATGGRELSGEGAGDNRLFIDFRLDAETDHWLLDEFQDTSFGQWSVLKNLVDEAVQDPTGARSFFYVGDVKQAIYAWREGDPRLFREIFDHYNAAQPGLIAERHLVESYRSGPPIIGMVNDVFGTKAAPVLAELFPGEASAAWNREWRDHATAKPELGGHVALLHAEDEAGRFATTLQLLTEIDPLGRGLTAAVLVQKNDTAAALADFLRREGGLPAVAEADLHVCTDNPCGAALLALVKAAAHPGDTLAWEHVRMTPLGEVFRAAGVETHEALTRVVLGRIHAVGFEHALDAWWQLLEPKLDPADAFTRQRARQFMAAAGLFDATGSREVAEFVEFMARHTVRDADSAAVVRVMTVHKAKGLGFDLVILPDLEGQKLGQARDGIAVHRSAAREVEWVFDLPAKDIATNDPVLAAHLREAEAAACYEKLSLLYVAMTRAKRAMYLVIKPSGKSTSRNFTKLLGETLGEANETVRIGQLELPGAYAAGDADWHTQITMASIAEVEATAAVGATLQPLDPAAVKPSHRLAARRPSDGKTGLLPAAALFAAGAGHAASFGAEVHEVFSLVEWAEMRPAGGWVAAWAKTGLGADALAVAQACVEAPALAEVWARPAVGAGKAEVWRERAFEVVIDGAWITGVFDRVVVARDAAGRATGVTVWDFKTDRAETETDVAAAIVRHAGQLNLYRRVAAVLTGLALERVVCELVLTRLRRRVAIPPAGGR